jgi:site-specific DNA-methyltransferase (adenine-specific)
MKVPIDTVLVDKDRYRTDFGNIEELAISISKNGLLHPIVVDNNMMLIAGERRLRAHRMLGLTEIEVNKLNEIPTLQKKEIEVEENLKRKNFTWQEEVKAKLDLHRIKCEIYGTAVKGHGGGWSLKNTAEATGDSMGTISRDLQLAKSIAKNPELAKLPSKEAAWKISSRKQEKDILNELASRVKVEVDTSCIVHGNAKLEIKKLENESVDLIHTDPPFGIALDKNIKADERWDNKVYQDDAEHVLDTISLVVKECYRVLKNDRHMYIWFGIQHYTYVLNLLKDVGFTVHEVPCVWSKKGGSGVGGTMYGYSSNYEVCFLAEKGRREMTKLGQPNVWEEQRVPPQRKVHPTEKPTTLVRRCIEMSSQPGELVLDPFAGSGSTLIGALECNRRALGFELDKEYYNQIVLKLEKMKSGGLVEHTSTDVASQTEIDEAEEV